MRPALKYSAVAALTIGLSLIGVACGSRIEVRTMSAPDAGLATLRTFRMLPGPARRDGRPVTGEDDPMITNSIANRALRDQIIKSFLGRGYVRDDGRADFDVAFYASAREKLDITAWDYGYPYSLRGIGPVPHAQTVTSYLEGSIVIDVVKSDTRDLLWRGEGRAQLTDDPARNVERLVEAAEAIVARFPTAATPNIVAVR